MPEGPDRPGDLIVEATPRFLKSKRQLPAPVQEALDDEVRQLMGNPLAGEMKAGALKAVRVVKFMAEKQRYLLAYTFDSRRRALTLIDVGVHENFYRDLEKYL